MSAKKKKVANLNAKKVIALSLTILVVCVLFLVAHILLFYKEAPQVNLMEYADYLSASSEALPETSKDFESAKNDTGDAIKGEAEKRGAGATQKEDSNSSLPPQKDIPSSYDFPYSANNSALAFIIDDAGENVDNVKKYTSLPFPLTIAVLPRVSHSKECADVIRSSGKEIILHQPMQAINLSINPGGGAVKSDMVNEDIARTVRENLSIIGPVKGMNNHEGSLITSDMDKIGVVLDVCREQKVYFLDSRTALPEDNKVKSAAKVRDMKVLERNAPFLDNAVTKEEMIKEIKKSVEVANKSGSAIIIGHVDKSVLILPDLLLDMYPELKAKGYRFVTPSEL